MLVSHLNHFIYTKTLKTAGTSIEIYFEGACLPPGSNFARGHYTNEIVTPAGIVGYRGNDSSGKMWYNHMAAKQIREQVGDAIWENYFKFCVIRNPFDKLVSWWWWTLTPDARNHYKQQDFSKVRSDFCQWVGSNAPAVVDRHAYQIDGRVCVDFFIRYEEMLNGLTYACDHVGFDFRPDRLGRYKSHTRVRQESFHHYFDKPATIAVESAFGWELDYFGYDLA
jgi:hypothetical protein